MSGNEKNQEAVKPAEETPTTEKQSEVKKEGQKTGEVSVSAGEKATVEAVQAAAEETPKLTLRAASKTPYVISVEDFYGFWVESVGIGVGDALVTLIGAAIASDRTSSSGYVSFKIKPINPGEVTVTASKVGFEPATLTLQVNPAPAPAKQLKIVRDNTEALVVGKPTRLILSVMDEEDQVVDGATLKLEGASEGKETRMFEGAHVIEFDEVKPGPITITATKQGYEDGTFTIAVPEEAPQTFVPRPRRSFLDEIKPVKVSEEPERKPKPSPKPKGPSITDVLFGWLKTKYGCPRCKKPVEKGVEECPNCGETIDWKGVA